MTTAIAKPVQQKSQLLELRKLVERQMRETAEKLKEMQAVIDKLNSALGEVVPRSGPLDQLKQVVESTQDLRVPSGNISAENVAKVYGVSVSELATWLGKSRQTVTKTPDADSLQPALSFFERVARLRIALKTESDFRKWL